jgi:hypothetical protein
MSNIELQRDLEYYMVNYYRGMICGKGMLVWVKNQIGAGQQELCERHRIFEEFRRCTLHVIKIPLKRSTTMHL